MDRRVKQVIALMEKCLHQGRPASWLARRVNLSASRLHQLFKEETGQPPARYLHALRMARARELLESSYLSVKQVMSRVGVSDESHFVRDFKKTYGFTPARYRESFRNGDADGRTGADARVAPGRGLPRTAPRRSPPSLPTAPPLLVRRASHPRQLAEDSAPLLRARKHRSIVSLLKQRHASFAEATAAITDDLARGFRAARPIAYSPRRSAVSRRMPPAAERRHDD